MRKALVVGAAIALAFSVGLMAQPIVQNQFSGNECWNTGQGPGGPSTGFICSMHMRNGADIQTFSGSGAFTTTATPQNSTLMWTGTAPTTWTITLPSPTYDGQFIVVGTDTTLTTMVTINAGSGQTLSSAFNAQTVTAATSVMYQFDLPSLKWFRIR